MIAAFSRRAIIPLVLALATALAGGPSAQAPAPQDAAGRVVGTITAISAGGNGAARREAILTALRAEGVEPSLEPFGSGDRAGVNIIVTLPGAGASGADANAVLVGAHYDRVEVGRGVVDNAASCAALVELIRRFKAAPPARMTLRFAFFDREEAGLLGSQAHFAAAGTRPAHAVNLDIFAYGDTLFATAGTPDSPLLRSLKAVAGAASIPVRDVPPKSYPGSDHLSMIAAGIDTLGLAIVDQADVEGVLKTGIEGLKPGTGPRILTIIHTPNDTLAEVRPDQMMRGIAVVEALIREL